MLLADDPNPTRSWQEIAADAYHENNPQRLVELTKELERALDERDKKLRDSAKPNAKPAPFQD